MTPETVTAWVNGYIGAWESNDPTQIGALFTDNATYLTAPFRKPWVGRDAIVAGWLDRQDTPATNTSPSTSSASATTSPLSKASLATSHLRPNTPTSG
jgi:hypothetical protein